MMLSKDHFAEVVSFVHRLQPVSLYDNLNPALARAKAIADIIEIAISIGRDDFEPETIRYAAQAIRMEINDAQSMLEAYWNGQNSDKKSDDPGSNVSGGSIE